MNNDTSFDIIQESNPVQTVAQPKEDNKMLRATDRITALYCRLSVEDTKEDKKNGKEDLSNSIQNQKAILLQYARDHRFPHPTFFIDDGYSGVDFANRPGFQKMLAEIEAGNVGFRWQLTRILFLWRNCMRIAGLRGSFLPENMVLEE